MSEQSRDVTFLFTDIEGSTRLWEEQPERMHLALASHDALVRATIARHDGTVVKMTGDGVHAAFDNPGDALAASIELQVGLSDLSSTGVLSLNVRCGLHAGLNQRRDNDFFGSVVNRAARIMSAAHGGQILLSDRVASLVVNKLPEGVALRDLGSVRLRDLSRAEHVFQVVTPRLRSDFPALRSLESTPNNLPQQLTSFVGRERELAEIKLMLPDTRLLTLHGVGGIGKTRLSLQVAADVLDIYADGIWFVELAALSDPQMVPQVVAGVLGVKEEPGHSVIDAIAKYCSILHLLIVLDNCEHLVEACAQMTKQLIAAAPNLTILASSRERMQIGGETTYPVPSLSFPGSDARVTLEALEACESTRLFMDRAGSANPAFASTLKNASAVSNICRRLDGIPLAIELAAARTRGLSVEHIAERLDDRFRLLTTGDRTALPRQQTLRALIDWSYELLTSSERTLLRRLAVFAGGWTLEAAEKLAAGDGLEAGHVVDVLTQLVEKSLVVMSSDGSRYHLLDTVRSYAKDRLDEAGEQRACNTTHLRHYLQVVETARPELLGPDQARWLSLLDLEHENLLVAHAWCETSEDGAELDLRLTHAAKQYWINRGLLALGHRVQIEALSRPGLESNALLRCRGLFNAGQVCCFMARFDEAQGYLQDSLAIARSLQDHGRIEAVLQLLGMASLARGDLLSAQTHLDEALALAKRLDNKRELAAAINARAQLYRVQGLLDAAEPLFNDLLVIARELGDGEIIAIGLLNLAMVSISRGAEADARGRLLDALSIADEIGSKPAGQSVIEVTAGLSASIGQWRSAARLFGAAEGQAATTGLHRDPADAAFLLPLVEKARSNLDSAAYHACESEGRLMAYEHALDAARATLKAAEANRCDRLA